MNTPAIGTILFVASLILFFLGERPFGNGLTGRLTCDILGVLALVASIRPPPITLYPHSAIIECR